MPQRQSTRLSTRGESRWTRALPERWISSPTTWRIRANASEGEFPMAVIAETRAADRELIIERIFDAPRDVVFKAWTDPEDLARWWGPNGCTLAVCETDFRPGGGWRFCM